MMRKQYVMQHTNFVNNYRLAWITAGEAIPEGWERITRKEAYELCRAERRRMKNDVSFAGYGDSTILPFGAWDDPYYTTYETDDGFVYYRA